MNFITVLYNIFAFPVFYIFAGFYRIVNKKFKNREVNSVIHLNKLKSLKKSKPRIWFHAASMGEFEQAKPIIQVLKKKIDCEIIATFFSPSGYENQKDYKYSDHSFYLPLDTLLNAKNFINNLKPDLAIFIRYEIWHNFLSIINFNKIPLLLVAATKPNSKTWNYPILKDFYKHNLELFSMIYSAGDLHKDYFRSLNISTPVIGLNDTRYDRVYYSVTNKKNKVILNSSNKLKLVLGSSWIPDEELFSAIKEEYQLIIVPHEPSKSHISDLQERFPKFELFSELDNNLNRIDSKSVIVDSIGHLLDIYSIADIAYVGGGFGSGLHSVSEPAAYGLPIIVGENFLKSIDASLLYNEGGLFPVKTENDLKQTLVKLSDKEYRKQIGSINYNFIRSRIGSSAKIADDIIQELKI